MRYKLEIYSIQSDHLLAFPEFDHFMYVESDDIDKYIREKMTDGYGHHYEKADAKSKRIFGFDYTSHVGALNVNEYKEPKFEKG